MQKIQSTKKGFPLEALFRCFEIILREKPSVVIIALLF